MAIPTFVAGNTLTAAQMNTISTAFTIVDGWTTYTPTLTQSGAVTKTVTTARYAKFGRMVVGNVRLDITGAGTGANAIDAGTPPFNQAALTLPVGSAMFFDTSTGFWFPAITWAQSSTTFRFLSTDGHATTLSAGLGNDVSTFNGAVASGDALMFNFAYESTT